MMYICDLVSVNLRHVTVQLSQNGRGISSVVTESVSAQSVGTVAVRLAEVAHCGIQQ